MTAAQARKTAESAENQPNIELLMKRFYHFIEQSAREGKTSVDFYAIATSSSHAQKELVKKRLRSEGYKLNEGSQYNEDYCTIQW